MILASCGSTDAFAKCHGVCCSIPRNKFATVEKSCFARQKRLVTREKSKSQRRNVRMPYLFVIQKEGNTLQDKNMHI